MTAPRPRPSPDDLARKGDPAVPAAKPGSPQPRGATALRSKEPEQRTAADASVRAVGSCESCGCSSRPANVYCRRCGQMLGTIPDISIPGVDELLEGEVAAFTAAVATRRRSAVIAWLLWSLAPLGVPRFYMGRPGEGLLVPLLFAALIIALAVGLDGLRLQVAIGAALAATWAVEALRVRDLVRENREFSQWEALREIQSARSARSRDGGSERRARLRATTDGS